jgi:preprotein translocase subunit SecA
MNQQRKVIYARRMRALKNEDLREQAMQMVEDVVGDYVRAETSDAYSEDWDHVKLWTALKTLYPISLEWEKLVDEMEGRGDDLTSENLVEAILEDARAAYKRREAEVDAAAGPDGMRRLERQVMLTVLDRKWREHLYEMDYLKQGIGMRAHAQRDPLIEYQREGYDMFATMLEALKEESVGFLFNIPVQQPEPQDSDAASVPAAATQAARAQRAARVAQQAQPQRPPAQQPPKEIPPALRGGPPQQRLTYSGPSEDGSVESRGGGDQRNGQSGQGGSNASRRERRAAARDAAKKGKKGPRR